MYRSVLLILIALLSLSFSNNAQAQDKISDRLAVFIGGFDILDQDDESVDLRAEYRWGYKLWNLFHPFMGIEASTDGALYFLGGLLWDYKWNDHWFISPSMGAGYYKDGSGLDLGYGLQFRSQFEMGYEFENGHRLSGAISHISNADLGDHNPGAEVIGIYYSVPFDFY